MVTYLEEIKELEKELATTKYNKKTQHHIGLVKAKIARLKQQQISRSSSKKKGEGFSVKKSGDASVVLVGYPSAGKSTLLNELTNANSKIGAYSFTTLTVIPGQMTYKHANIQILDVPGIVKGAAMGTGRGKEVLAVMRNADLVIYLIDIATPQHLPILQKEVHDAGLRVNKKFPDVKIKRSARGGVKIGKTVRLSKLDNKTITAILHEFKINNADVLIRTDIDDGELIDVIEANKVYLPGMVILNKMDTKSAIGIRKVMKKTKAELAVSAEQGIHMDELKELIFQKLGFIRIYLKEPGKQADLVEPLIMFKGTTLHNLCDKLHRDFVTKFRFARIWGKSVKYAGQKVLKLKHIIEDNDVVEVHTA